MAKRKDDLRVPRQGQAKKAAMIGSLDHLTRQSIVHTSPTKRSSDFIAHLEQLDRLYGPQPGRAMKPVVLVEDNGPIHVSKLALAALEARKHWLTVEWLPKYAPELNDIEVVWHDLKAHNLAHYTFTDAADLDRAIHQAVQALNNERSRNPLVKRFRRRSASTSMACTSIATSATIQPDSKSLLDDIAASLKNFPDWRLRIVGHTDSTGDPQHNLRLSLDRATAIQAALVDRGIDLQRLVTAGLGEGLAVTSNATPDGRALNRRVELDRVTDSAEAKRMLKAMSDFLGAQKNLSFTFDSVFEVVTPTDQKLGLASSGTATLSRPDKIRFARSGGFADYKSSLTGRRSRFWERTPISSLRSRRRALSIS